MGQEGCDPERFRRPDVVVGNFCNLLIQKTLCRYEQTYLPDAILVS